MWRAMAFGVFVLMHDILEAFLDDKGLFTLDMTIACVFVPSATFFSFPSSRGCLMLSAFQHLPICPKTGKLGHLS